MTSLLVWLVFDLIATTQGPGLHSHPGAVPTQPSRGRAYTAIQRPCLHSRPGAEPAESSRGRADTAVQRPCLHSRPGAEPAESTRGHAYDPWDTLRSFQLKGLIDPIRSLIRTSYYCNFSREVSAKANPTSFDFMWWP